MCPKFVFIRSLETLDQQNGSVSKGTCLQAWWWMSSIPGTHMVEGREGIPRVVFWALHVRARTHTLTHKINVILNSLETALLRTLWDGASSIRPRGPMHICTRNCGSKKTHIPIHTEAPTIPTHLQSCQPSQNPGSYSDTQNRVVWQSPSFLV